MARVSADLWLLRRSSIVRGLRFGLPIRFVAAIRDTSVAMIERLDNRRSRFYRGAEDRAQRYPLFPKRDLALADPRNVEKILDQAGEMEELPLHTFANGLGLPGSGVLLQQVRARLQRGDRVAQFVPQDREKLILVAIRVPKGLRYVFEGIALCGDLLTLAVQVAKYIDLAAQDIRFDWLFDEIDRTCFISLKATLIVRASRRHSRAAIGMAHGRIRGPCDRPDPPTIISASLPKDWLHRGEGGTWLKTMPLRPGMCFYADKFSIVPNSPRV